MQTIDTRSVSGFGQLIPVGEWDLVPMLFHVKTKQFLMPWVSYVYKSQEYVALCVARSRSNYKIKLLLISDGQEPIEAMASAVLVSPTMSQNVYEKNQQKYNDPVIIQNWTIKFKRWGLGLLGSLGLSTYY